MNERRVSQEIKGDGRKFTSTKSWGKKPKELNFYAFPSNLPSLVTSGGKCSFWNQLYYSTLRCLLVYSIDPSQLCSFFSLKLPSPYEIGYCQRTFRRGFECNFKGQTEQLSKHCKLRKVGLVTQEGWDFGFLLLISLISLQAKVPFHSNQVKLRQHGHPKWRSPPSQSSANGQYL